MNDFVLGGASTSALTHFAMFGFAAILEDAGYRPVRLRWTEDREPRAVVSFEGSPGDAARAVKDFADRAVAPESWLNARVQGLSVEGRALFSPRASVPTPDEWESFVEQRHAAMPERRLDQLMIGALGEPAWWRVEETNTPDGGASRLEMKTRNRGAEMVRDRLIPLATALAARTSEQVRDGLLGHAVLDETGTRGASRTPSGFTPPQETDTALAWCALAGLVVAPPTRHISTFSATPGVWPRTRTNPDVVCLPMWTKPVSVDVVRAMLNAAEFDSLVRGDVQIGTQAWLAGRGVRAVMRFPVLVGGSASAPERMLLTGELDVLGAP